MTSDPEKLRDHVDRSLHELLAARAELVGATKLAERTKSLDAAMVIDLDYQRLRTAFHTALHALADGETKLEVEAAANALVVRALEIGWRVGFMAHVAKGNDG